MKIDNLLISVKSPPIGTVYTVPTGGTVREAIIHSIPVEDIRTIVIAPPVTAGVTVGQNHTYDYRYRNTSRMRNFYVNDSLLPTQCPQIDLNIPFIQHQGPSGRSN